MPETSTAGRWTLHLSAQPRLVSQADQVLALEGLDALLLAWLALEGPTPRVRLMDLLWPEETRSPTLRNRLRQRLFTLKRRLGAEAVIGNEILSLGPAVFWPGHDAAADDGAMLASVSVADAGELAQWLTAQRDAQHASRRAHLANELARFEREGRLAEAIDLAQRQARLDPLHEHAHRQLMRLHYLHGDRAAALVAFEQCERLLKDELGVKPGAETLALLAQVENASAPMRPVVRPVAPSLLRPPRLVGRNLEWQQLLEAWARRMPVVLVGEGGLGKSRLLADLAAAQAAPVVHVAARPGDADLALTLLSRVLRALAPVRDRQLPAGVLTELARLLPELGDAPPADAGTELRLHNAVRATVAAAAAQGMFALVLDDLHLADAASLDWLRALLAEPTPVWAAALRPGPQPPALQTFLQALLSQGEAVQIALQALAPAAIAEFCDSLGLPGLEGHRWADALHQRTGGNPQYMLEILKAWWSMPQQDSANTSDAKLPTPASPAKSTLPDLPTPVSLPGLVSQRIGALSAAAIDLARCAAVAGEDFSPELAAAVLRLRPVDLADPWAELEAARVFAGERFAHDLIAEAAAASVPAPVARALHADIAGALQQGATPHPVEPARLAHHWQQAGRWPAAAVAFEASARRCAEQGRRADEAEAWRRAAQAWARADDADRRFDAMACRTEVLIKYGAGTPARLALDELESQAHEPAQQRRFVVMRLAHAQAVGDFETTLALAPAAIESAWAEGGPSQAFPIALSLSGASAKLYRGAEGVALLERLRDWIDGPEATDEQRRQYWNAMALVLDFSNRFGEALQAWRNTQHHARRLGSDLLSQAISNEAFTLNKMGRMAEAVERGREALRLDLAQGDGLTSQLDNHRLALGHHLRNIGAYGEALPMLQQAREHLQTSGLHVDAAVATHLLAVIWVHLGQPNRAHRLLADDLPRELPRRLHDMREAHRVMAARAMGDRTAAARAWQIAKAMDEADDSENLVPRVGALLVIPALPAEHAEDLAVRLADWFSARQRMGHALAAHVRAGAAALAQGSIGRARRHVQAADELARAYQPDIVYAAERFWVAAQVHEALGQPDDRRKALETARLWILERAQGLEPALQRAYLERQPINADLLRWSGR